MASLHPLDGFSVYSENVDSTTTVLPGYIPMSHDSVYYPGVLSYLE